MSLEQAAILILLAVMLVAFCVDRFRVEVVALCGLAAGLVLGLVPLERAFSGLSNPAFVTVLEILLIVPVLARSGVLDPLARLIPRHGRSEAGTIGLLCLVTALLSVFMNNIGALALMIPVTVSVCRVSAIDQRRALMPIGFAALLGGLCSIAGTPANLLVSQELAARTGTGFRFFDFAWVGVPVAVAGIAAILLWSRKILPGGAGEDDPKPREDKRVVAEFHVAEGSPLAGLILAEAPFSVGGIRRGGANLFYHRADTRLATGDLVFADIALCTLESLAASGAIALPAARNAAFASLPQAVVMPESTLLGSRIADLAPLATRGIEVVAVGARGQRLEGSFADLRLGIGDVLHLAGDPQALDEAADEAQIMVLAPERHEAPLERDWMPVSIFAAGVAIAAFGLLEPQFAFAIVVILLALTGSLNIRKGFGELDWPILVMMAAMIPLGLAIADTGAASVLGTAMVDAMPAASPLAVAAVLLLLAVLITPFVNNAAAAIVLAPLASQAAAALGMSPAPFLMAVTIGASIDFLTPIGHHNNTVVMGIAGYRFLDFARSGWPVTLAAVGMAIAALGLFWL